MNGSSLPAKQPHVVIVGGGFGGLTAAQSLDNGYLRVTLIDRSNHHLFQPLLYQVAMAGLSPAEIAMPIRSIISGQDNAQVLLGEVAEIDLGERFLRLSDGTVVGFDYLILAAGARTNYFGNSGWSEHALGLKSIDDAVEIRRRVLLAFERAEREAIPGSTDTELTFTVIGGGPTGVELAGALSELSQRVLAKDFRKIKPERARVILLEGGPRVLGGFDEALSKKALEQLNDLGVEVRTGARVTDINQDGVSLGETFIRSDATIWAAGVAASPLTEQLGVKLDRAGRVMVMSDCSIPGHRHAFAIGDIAHFKDPDGNPLPGVSPVAMQQARHAAEAIRCLVRKENPPPFVYTDKGSMATIGRSRAIAQMGKVHASGFLAWGLWLVVHIFYLMGFKNRIFVFMQWVWSYLTYRRGARLITGPRISPKTPEGA